MGQKVSPHGLRVGVIKDWDSKWYGDKKHFAEFLAEDNKVRVYVKKKLYAAGISKVLIERASESKIRVIILTAKPGMVIGRSGDGIEVLKKDLVKMTGKEVEISIEEVRRAELDAQLTAESVAQALERRVTFRRAMKQVIGRTMKANAKGIKVTCSGRLGGAEIARSESYSEGNVPLHTLRADIAYGFAEADTTYGKLGVKVWINNGEHLSKDLKSNLPEEAPKSDRKRGDRRDRRDGDRPRRERNDRRDRKNGEVKEEKKFVNPRKRPAKPVVVEAAPAEEVVTEASAE
jgi:small subunit ribosomal protein S3